MGIHVRRTDKGREAPSNFAASAAEVAEKAARCAAQLGVVRAFIAGDDAVFLRALKGELKTLGMVVAPSWPSLLSARGRAAHFDAAIPGPEAAADALADAFCLSQCQGLLATYSSLATWAALWAKDRACWWHVRYPQVECDPWADPAFPLDVKAPACAAAFAQSRAARCS